MDCWVCLRSARLEVHACCQPTSNGTWTTSTSSLFAVPTRLHLAGTKPSCRKTTQSYWSLTLLSPVDSTSTNRTAFLPTCLSIMLVTCIQYYANAVPFKSCGHRVQVTGPQSINKSIDQCIDKSKHFNSATCKRIREQTLSHVCTTSERYTVQSVLNVWMYLAWLHRQTRFTGKQLSDTGRKRD